MSCFYDIFLDNKALIVIELMDEKAEDYDTLY